MTRKLIKSFERADCYKLLALTFLNALFCGFFPIVAMYLSTMLDGLLSPFISSDVARVVVIDLALAMICAIPGGIFISKLRVWLLSLPVQFVLYFAILAFIYGSMSISALISVLMLAAQIPGIFSGLLIRYLVRKVKAHKQSALAE